MQYTLSTPYREEREMATVPPGLELVEMVDSAGLLALDN